MNAVHTKKSPLKKLLVTTLQIAFTVAILYWVLRDPEKRALMLVALGNAEIFWIVMATVSFGVLCLLGAWRWNALLRAQSFAISYMRTLALFMIGMFFNLFMLGSTGGDVVKFFYLMREVPDRRATAFLTIMMDRVVGLFALIILATALMIWRYSWITSHPGAVPYVHGLMFFLVSALGGILFVILISALRLEMRLPERTPLRAKLVEMAGAFRSYGSKPGTLVLCFVISIFAHLTYFSGFYFIALSVRAVVEASNFFAIMPIIATFTAMPVTFAGLGLREKLFEELLGKLAGVPLELCVLIASVGFAVTMIWGLVGGAVFLFYRHTPGGDVSLSEIEAAVEETVVQQEPGA